MGTRTIRVIDEDYQEAIALLDKERGRLGIAKTSFQKQILSSETNWLSHLLEKGIGAYRHDTSWTGVK